MPMTFELQIRTLFMHAYAEPQHKLEYKGVAELPAEIRKELSWIAGVSVGSGPEHSRACVEVAARPDTPWSRDSKREWGRTMTSWVPQPASPTSDLRPANGL